VVLRSGFTRRQCGAKLRPYILNHLSSFRNPPKVDIRNPDFHRQKQNPPRSPFDKRGQGLPAIGFAFRRGGRGDFSLADTEAGPTNRFLKCSFQAGPPLLPFNPDVSRIACCDRGYDRPSGRPRVSDPATYRSDTPRIQPPAVNRWHGHLHGLATPICETSGLVNDLISS
jgi:hypothetical protein